jgi:hypothetical protein
MGGCKVVDYKKMYFKLAAHVADAVELLEKAQQEGESEYVSSSEFAPLKLSKQARKKQAEDTKKEEKQKENKEET